jgi:hypothetical protein
MKEASMGRSSAAVIGHNHRDLNDDELGALVTSFTTKLLAVNKREDRAATELSSIRKEKSGIFKLVAKETGYLRKEFEAEVIANLDKSEEELIAAAKRVARLQTQAGLRTGEQLDLVDRIADTVDDAIAAEAAGYRAGRRADDSFPLPDNINPIFATDYQRGWVRGQEVNAKAEAMAAEILARPKPGAMVAGDDPDEEEDQDDEAAIQGGVKALKEAGWVAPTEAEAKFEEADGGKTIRRPRAAASEAAAA